jgi:hypothetical protein
VLTNQIRFIPTSDHIINNFSVKVEHRRCAMAVQALDRFLAAEADAL